MKALIHQALGESSVEEVSTPEPTEDEVLIKVHRVQLGITDCWRYLGEDTFGLETLKERIENGSGRILGHEFCGEIAAVGNNVSKFDVGDHIYKPGHISCGECPYCQKGYNNLCEDSLSIGTDVPGALAEYLTTSPEPLALLPDEVSHAEGAAMQPVASAAACVNSSGLQEGDTAAVIGAGQMGTLVGQIANHVGAQDVHIYDVSEKMVELAKNQGLSAFHVDEVDDPVSEIKDRTGGIGPDVVFESVGGDQTNATSGDDTLAEAFRMVRNGGEVVQVGVISGPVSFETLKLRGRGVRWTNPKDPLGDYELGPQATIGEWAAELVASDRVNISDYLTHEVEGLESVDEAVEITLNKEEYGAYSPAQIIIST